MTAMMLLFDPHSNMSNMSHNARHQITDWKASNLIASGSTTLWGVITNLAWIASISSTHLTIGIDLKTIRLISFAYTFQL